MRRSPISSARRFTSIGVLAAMPEELREIRARLGRPRPTMRGGIRVWTGDLAGFRATVALTGEGAANARRGAEALLGLSPRPGLLVALGVAGALDPRLQHGDLVLATRVVSEGRPALHADRELIEALSPGAATRGWIATVDRIVASAADKNALLRHWSASMTEHDLGPGLVDLESRSVVEVAERLGVPWLVLRAVSDTASDSLPDFLEQCRRTDGGIHRRAVLLHALRNPGSLPALVRLGWRTRRCARALAHDLEQLLTLHPK